MNLETADKVLKGAIAMARELGAQVNVAIVGETTSLKTFVRMDGAMPGNIDIAIKKAETARLFGVSTDSIGKDDRLYDIQCSGMDITTYPGGLPIRNKEGKIIGAIGVSGSTAADDHEIATAGAKTVL